MNKIKSIFLKLSLKIFRKFFNKISGKLNYQNIFEELHSMSLQGMNIGGGAGTSSSGEIYAIKHVKSNLREKNPVIFDVGANIGLYSKLLLDNFGKNAQIHSFEPSFQTYEKLKVNLAQSNVSMFNFGFGESDSKVTLYSNKESSGLASVYNRRLDHFGIDMNLKEEIELKSLDSFCEEKGIHKIDFLKIDVEGHELSVLSGAKNLLEQGKISFIQFEFGGCNIDSRTYFQDFYYLLSNNYQLYRIVKDGIFKISNYKEMYEAFATTNYLAELIQKNIPSHYKT